MSGLGTTKVNMQPDYQVNIRHAPVIAVLCTMEIVELFLIYMVIRPSWISYRANRRNNSIFGFLKSLPFMKKCFLGSGGVIIFFNTACLIEEAIPNYYDDTLCTLKVFVLGALRTCVSMGAVYGYYWARQYRLNSSPVLRTVIPKWFYFVSKTSLVLTVIGFAYPVVSLLPGISFKSGVLILPLVAKNKENDCYNLDHNASISRIFGTPLILMSLQLLYVFLFYKTLRFHQEANRNAASENNGNLVRIAKRCFITATITVMTDCSTVILATSRSIPLLSYAHLIPQINLMFNMMAMIFCFISLSDFLIQFKEAISCGFCKQNDEGQSPDQAGARAA